MSTVDLNNPLPNHNYSVQIDPEEKDADRYVRLAKDMMVFLLAVAFVVLITVLCVRTLIDPNADPEEKKWAMSLISVAGGGLIGYLVRR